MLTRKQKTYLTYLEANPGAAYTDIQAYLGLKSRSSAFRLVVQLEERGFVVRVPFRARSIKVVRPLVTYTNAAYYTVERIEGEARLVPWRKP